MKAVKIVLGSDLGESVLDVDNARICVDKLDHLEGKKDVDRAIEF